jgi:hypothetical protein
MPDNRTSWAEVTRRHRERYDMAGRAAGPASYGNPGTVPIGDRPGTTSLPDVETWGSTPAGQARLIFLGAFAYWCFVHVAASARFAGE